jgi:hypothetical protein
MDVGERRQRGAGEAQAGEKFRGLLEGFGLDLDHGVLWFSVGCLVWVLMSGLEFDRALERKTRRRHGRRV